MKIYKELENDLITKIRNDVVTATNSAASAMMCRQVANGSLYLTPEVEELVKMAGKNRKVAMLHDEKLDALQELFDELQGQQVLVAYDFQHDLERLKQRFETRAEPLPYIGGGVSPARAKELEERWLDKDLPYLFGHPQSIAHGLNLQGSHAHHVCFYSMTYDFELYDQFIKRLWRSGNKAPFMSVHHILARDTVDYVMLYALKSKNKGQRAFFQGLIELAKEYH
jgi:hypothetical protein